jgi:chemotaxis protein CheZ
VDKSTQLPSRNCFVSNPWLSRTDIGYYRDIHVKSDGAPAAPAGPETVSAIRFRAHLNAQLIREVPAMSDDFDALFEEVAAQRTATLAEPEPAAPPAAIPESTAPAREYGEARQPHDAATARTSDNPMFERLGGIVRLLHDSLRELGYDRTLHVATSQITDAQDRLEYIATLTEQAANKVLNTIDEGMPAQDELAKQARDMDSRWTQLYDGKLSVEEFKVLAADSRSFAGTVLINTDTEKARLLEIMMAQDFQDITGQLIKKIVVITQKVEIELAQLLRDNAPPELLKERSEEKENDLMQGPAIVGVAMQQDDVDSLLDGLGF